MKRMLTRVSNDSLFAEPANLRPIQKHPPAMILQ